VSAPDEAELLPLIAAARAVREHAYAPYSGFRVGAAIRARSGAVYVGCNVENASYGATVCAERAAIFAMVAAAERAFSAIAIYTESDELTMPCGMCRQVLYEFAEDAHVVVANGRRSRVAPFGSLLPEPFVLER
jgi:cytidine deaminase